MSYSDIPTYVGQPYPYDLSLPIPVIGWTDPKDTDGIAMPILAPATPEYKARLDSIHNSRSARSIATDNFSAEDFDRKCTEAHEYNVAYRARHGL